MVPKTLAYELNSELVNIINLSCQLNNSNILQMTIRYAFVRLNLITRS